MIKANHKNFWVWFSGHYSKYLLKFYFRNIRYIGDFEKTNLPVLIISNHFSWWDGFIQIQLNNKFYKRKFHFMMLENELRKSMVLTKIGAFSVMKRNRSSLESLRYALEILQNQQNMLLFFPQGRIQSIYRNEFTFEKGLVSFILENMKDRFQFVFNVNLIDYSAKRRPEISVYHKTYDLKVGAQPIDIETDFNQFARECMTKQIEE
jgi:1-acyl-sn-glycerol-3-phosphate acyltransferase